MHSLAGTVPGAISSCRKEEGARERSIAVAKQRCLCSSTYVGKFGLNCSWMNAFIVKEFLYFLSDAHVFRETIAAYVRWCNDFRATQLPNMELMDAEHFRYLGIMPVCMRTATPPAALPFRLDVVVNRRLRCAWVLFVTRLERIHALQAKWKNEIEIREPVVLCLEFDYVEE